MSTTSWKTIFKPPTVPCKIIYEDDPNKIENNKPIPSGFRRFSKCLEVLYKSDKPPFSSYNGGCTEIFEDEGQKVDRFLPWISN